MNQARHQDGSRDHGWYEDDEQHTRSLGVWPLGGTYIHSSEGALSTGPASGGATGGRRARGRDGSQRGRSGVRRHGAGAPNAPVAHDRPPTGRPPLYQVGGRYRGDDWPTDPGFRRGGREHPRGRSSGASDASGAFDANDANGDDRGRTPREPRPHAALQAIVQRIRRIPSLYPRLLFVVVGYAAITSLAAAYAQKIPLPVTASLIVIPAAGLILNLGMRYPAWGRRALVGWVAGIVATIIYDCLRLALVKLGIWGDPIPGIGRLVLSDPHANFAWGYLWRFLGNGGGMGIAYTMLPWRGWRTGVAYGTLICTGLVGLLYLFPVAQVHFLPLTPVTVIGGYAGHWVYGAVLGWLTCWWLPPVEPGRIHRRLTARLRHPGHRWRPTHARSGGTSATEERFRRAVERRSA